MNDNEKPREPRWIRRLARMGRVAETFRGKSQDTFGPASTVKQLMAWSCACGWQGTSRDLKPRRDGLACPMCSGGGLKPRR
jgi:hypothetical protein